jgi:hypothetical protein
MLGPISIRLQHVADRTHFRHNSPLAGTARPRRTDKLRTRLNRIENRWFLNEQLFVGAVGYYYQQLTADSGQLAILGPNESRTRGVGPQIGYNFNVGGVSIYTNLRDYTEFGSYRRVQGHAIYFTVSLPLSALFGGHSQ